MAPLGERILAGAYAGSSCIFTDSPKGNGFGHICDADGGCDLWIPPHITPPPYPCPPRTKKKVCLLNNRTDGVADSRPSVQMVRMHQRSLFRADQIKFVWSVSTTSGSKMSNVAKTKVFQLSACHDIFGDCNMKYFGWKTDFLGNGKYLWNAVWVC